MRLTNETRLREYMRVITDKGIWRVDFEGDPVEGGCFRLHRRPARSSGWTEWPESFPGRPGGMSQIVDIIEAEDASKLGGQASPRVHGGWQIHFEARAETDRCSWVLPWSATEAHLFGRVLEEFDTQGRDAALREVQELLGHASPTTTARYTHKRVEHLRQAVQRLADHPIDRL